MILIVIMSFYAIFSSPCPPFACFLFLLPSQVGGTSINGNVCLSKAVRNKELEIIPISPGPPRHSAPPTPTPGASVGSHRGSKVEPKVSISAVPPQTNPEGVSGGGQDVLSNGLASGKDPHHRGHHQADVWKDDVAKVSIQPLLQLSAVGASGTGAADDAPLNLSMKSGGKPSEWRSSIWIFRVLLQILFEI